MIEKFSIKNRNNYGMLNPDIKIKVLNPMIKLKVLNQIKQHGPHNKIYSAAIETMFGFTGSTLRDYIRELRRDGEPIVMSREGYYYEDSFNAVEKTVNNLESRAFSMLKTSNILRKRYKKGQFEIKFIN